MDINGDGVEDGQDIVTETVTEYDELGNQTAQIDVTVCAAVKRRSFAKFH